MSIRKIGTGETGEPLVLAELSPAEKVALLNILTLFDHYLPDSGLTGTRDGRDAELMVQVIRDAFRLNEPPARPGDSRWRDLGDYLDTAQLEAHTEWRQWEGLRPGTARAARSEALAQVRARMGEIETGQ